jgi:hypothetical protein
MDIRSRKTRKIAENLEKLEKSQSGLRAAITRNKMRLNAGRNALRVAEPSVTVRQKTKSS